MPSIVAFARRIFSARSGVVVPPPVASAGPPPPAEFLANLDRGAAGGTPRDQFGAALSTEATVVPVVVVTVRTAHWVSRHGAEHHSCTGVRTGAPLAFSRITTNLAGSVLLALRPTT